MKVAVRGNPQVLGNTPEEILAGLLELGFLAPEGASLEAYVDHLEQVLADQHGIRVPKGVSPDERAERIVLGLVETGQLDLLED
ncbi:MAG TPA: hypothetical protein VIK98_04635 [Limnochordales bacterium]